MLKASELSFGNPRVGTRIGGNLYDDWRTRVMRFNWTWYLMVAGIFCLCGVAAYCRRQQSSHNQSEQKGGFVHQSQLKQPATSVAEREQRSLSC